MNIKNAKGPNILPWPVGVRHALQGAHWMYARLLGFSGTD